MIKFSNNLNNSHNFYYVICKLSLKLVIKFNKKTKKNDSISPDTKDTITISFFLGRLIG